MFVVDESVRRVCQLTGEWDRTTGSPVPGRTLSRYGRESSTGLWRGPDPVL